MTTSRRIRRTLALALLCAPVRLGAQDVPRTPSAPDASQSPGVFSNLHLFKGDDLRGSSPPTFLNDWRIVTEIGSSPVGIPRWRVGVRTTRELSSRLQVGMAATATRGSYGPSFWSRELGTDRDLSIPTPLTGPNSYKTTWDTTFTVAVPVKNTGRVRVNAIVEAWNPFIPTSTTDVVPLSSRALRFGIGVKW